PLEVDDTDRRPLAQHRNAEHGADAADLYRVPEGEFRVGEHVVNMDDLAFFDGSSDQRPSSGRNRVSRHEGRMLGRLAVVGDLLECAAMLAMVARSASHNLAADSTSVSSTVCRSNVERLMTLSTSAVAVCCCSDSRSSLSRRVFSIAITAWRAKLVTSS